MKRKNNMAEEKNSILKQHGYTLYSKQLGTGAFSTVETAYSSQHKQEVAVKIIPKINAARDFLTKFLPRELDIMKKLIHPNIVMFLQAIETNVKIYLILELVKGGSILKAIHRKRRIQDDVAANIMFQICNGLEYCHGKGIAHRDLKCENILLDTKGHVKIIDFGFACDNLLPIAGKYTRSSTFCGSYAYASPEILQGIPYIPQLSDVWSLGVILYVMLHGHLPFEDVNLKRLIRLVLAGPVFRPEVTLTPEAESIILFVLRKESTRPYIEDVKQHPWLKKASSELVTYIPDPETEPSSPTGSHGLLELSNM